MDPTIPGVGTNRYAYSGNDPINRRDPSGHFFSVDTILDIGFIAYDVGVLAYDETFNAGQNRTENLSALTADGIGAVVPGVTGLGVASRMAKVDDAVRVTKGVDEAIGATKGASPKNGPPNSYGQKGKPDHQAAVEADRKTLQADIDAGKYPPGSTVESGTKMPEANRKPDNRVAGPDGRTLYTREQDRDPTGKRNRGREAEYDQLGIPNDTYGVGRGSGKGKSDGGSSNHEAPMID